MIHAFKNGIRFKYGMDRKSYLKLPKHILKNMYPSWRYSAYGDDIVLLRQLLNYARNIGYGKLHESRIYTLDRITEAAQIHFLFQSVKVFETPRYVVWFHKQNRGPILCFELADRELKRSFFLGRTNRRARHDAFSRYDSGITETGTCIQYLNNVRGHILVQADVSNLMEDIKLCY